MRNYGMYSMDEKKNNINNQSKMSLCILVSGGY